MIALQKTGTGVNTALPTSSQMDVLINSGDVVSIRQTIQRVIASTLSCTLKSQYLNNFLGRIESFIAIKKSQSSQFSHILESTRVQIASLKAQIADFTDSITQLNIASLHVQLSTILDELQVSYNFFNNGNIDLTPFNLNITVNIQSIKTLSVQLEESKAQTVIDVQALGDTNILIASLEAQLTEAKANKAKL